MSLRTVSFQDTYWSGENDLIKEFYVPCMEESVEYCRAVGYFHSSIFCYITNGLYPFIQNGGRIRIVCSVNVSPEDERQIALGYDIRQASVYKGYKRDKIEMRGNRAEMSDFPLYLNTVAGGLDCRDQTIGGFSFVVKIYALPVVEIIG